MYSNDPQKEIATISDMSSTGDKITFTPAFPSEIVEFGVIVTTALVDAAGGTVLKVDVRPTAGSDTSRTDGTGGTLTLTSAQSNIAAGTVVRSRPTSPITVNPGQQAVLELTTAPDSGAGIGFIVFKHKPAYRDAAESAVVTS